MILSRVVLNPLHPASYRFIGSRYGIHKALCACANSNRKKASILFRIESSDRVSLLIQSSVDLNWDRLGVHPRAILSAESKTFDPQFISGQRLGFRLACRPTKKEKREGRLSAARYLRTDAERLAWLQRQAERWGFRVENVEFTAERWYDDKPLRRLVGDSDDDPVIDRSGERKGLPATRFDGTLIAVDPDRLLQAVQEGIGDQKAFGFGLLSLGRES